jgi:hypothetical protein
MDGQITVEEIQQFNTLLSTHPDLESYYFKCVQLQFALRGVPIACKFTLSEELDLNEATNSGYDVVMDSKVSLRGVDINDILAEDKEETVSLDSNIMQALQELAECERTAPTVIVKKPVVERELIQKVDNSNFKIFAGSVNKPLLSAVISVAACFTAFFGYLYFMSGPILPVVAHLTDSIDAVWDEEMQLPDYDDCMRQSCYRLTAGYVNFRFNSGAEMTIEAPAQWSLLDVNHMHLTHGRIYAVVPEQARGFSVTAGNT